MCGICGFLTREPIDIEQLTRMNDSMIHRGPNDSGVEIYPQICQNGISMSLGLAQRRLSIQDLSPRGHQPMHSMDGRVLVVFNGEIYNYKELRNKLDYPFKSDCDTEVIIAAYIKWGINCVDHFNGMFSIALFDKDNGKLFLLRDRLGVKPLYYWISENGIVFSSELKAIMLHPDFDEKIRTDVLMRLFIKKYIGSEDTIFENVFKVEPGTCIEFNGSIAVKNKYWDAYNIYKRCNSESGNSKFSDFAIAKQALKNELEQSIRYRLISDVPIGLFLSGGYDSSLIAAMAQCINGEPLNTFSIGFEDEKISESKYAKAVAHHIGTNHINRTITESDMLGLIEDIAYYYDEPFADGSQLPMMLVSKLARDEGVTVVLTGDGGDELFCGYESYIPGIKNDARHVISDRLRVSLVRKLVNDVNRKIVKYSNLTKAYNISKYSAADNRQFQKMLLDIDTYLPDDICCKVDRATMRYSLEARCPFLDKNIVELSYRIPQEYKYYNGNLKFILKELAYDYVPKNVLDRPKQGFGIPYNKWLHGKLRGALLDYSSTDYIRKQDIYESNKLNAFISKYLDQSEGVSPDYSDIAWAFLMFQMWYDRWIKEKG